MLDSEIRISVDVAMPTRPGLRYVSDDAPAIRRRREGKGFVYLDARGKRVADADMLKRIRSLVIPRHGQRLDLPVRGRTHSGDWPRRQRAQTIEVSR